jgi:dienelactone hydrolase
MRAAVILSLSICLLGLSAAAGGDLDITRVLEPGQVPADARLGKQKTLNDYFPWTPPANLDAWSKRRTELRQQMQVALGLWPMPPGAPLNPVIHGAIDRDGYTIEKVFFTSYPGHYVSGNLYRPKGRPGKLPGVLCPHGHWANGRFYDALASSGEAGVQKQLTSGAEQTREGARYPLQARCAELARMGCVVFHYDMVGVADSQQIPHREGFRDADAELRSQNFMGLQSYNSIRALDFLAGLSDVDPERIGVTGASGGGTQTFILCAIDDRPTVAFPAVMVSTAMQGGCVCENCSYLRVGTGNIELAALFAPKPLGMSGAHDWTIDIETRGLPQLKQLYRLFGAEDRVMARCYPQFEHNYNQVSRELMYNWFNKHLKLDLPVPVKEKPFKPVPPAELSVYDAQHPRPADAVDAHGLRKRMTEISEKQLTSLRIDDPNAWRRTMDVAWRVMIGDHLPEPEAIATKVAPTEGTYDGVLWRKQVIGRKNEGDQIPILELRGSNFNGTVVIWIHPEGKASLAQAGKLVPAAQAILERGAAIVAPDVFLTGEFAGAKPPTVDAHYAGFTFGYNLPLLSLRVHDILTAVAFARQSNDVRAVDLLGLESAGPWALLARAVCGERIARSAIDCAQFRFDNVNSTDSPMMLPGAVKFGGLPVAVALCDTDLYLHNAKGTGIEASGRVLLGQNQADPAAAVAWLLQNTPDAFSEPDQPLQWERRVRHRRLFNWRFGHRR